MPFATPTHVGTRMGRELTAAEIAQAAAVIETVEGLIVDAVGMTNAAITALDPFPAALKALCVEKAVAVIANPQGFESQTEALGAYSHTDRFDTGSEPAAAIFLTDDEQRRARRAVAAASFVAVTLTTPYSGDDSTDDESELPL